MRYGFINNFSQTLAAELAAGATTLTLDGGGSLLSNASADLVYTLTLDDGEGTTEIVHVTGASGNDLTIERGKEGTTDAAWTAGSTVEMRVTAGVLGFFQGYGGEVSAGQAQAIGAGAVATAYRSTALGEYYAEANGEYGVALGGAWAQGDYSISIGYSAAWGAEAVAIGGDSEAYAKSVVVGAKVYGQADATTCVGPYTSSFGKGAVSAGHYTSAFADYSVVLGAGIETSVVGGYRCSAVPYLASSPDDHYAYDFPGHGSGEFAAPPVTRRTSPTVVIATDPLDLTDNSASVTLDLPAGTMLFINTIDVVITGSDAPGGIPEIVIGPDDIAPAAYLAATAIGKTAVGGRETHAPLVTDGVASLRVATTTAGTGTTYQAKIIFSGYVMEL